MILDERTEFADGASVTGAAGTRNLTDIIDLTDQRDIGNGRTVYAYFTIDTAPTGADTVEFKIVSDSTDTIATDGSATQHASTGAIPIAQATVGKTYMLSLPIEGNVYERYLAAQVTNVGAGALADLVVSAGLTLDPKGWKAYPEGNN